MILFVELLRQYMQQPEPKKKEGKSANSREAETKNYISEQIILQPSTNKWKGPKTNTTKFCFRKTEYHLILKPHMQWDFHQCQHTTKSIRLSINLVSQYMQQPQLKNKIGKSANSRKAKRKYYISKTIIWLIKNHANAIQPPKSVKRD